MVGSALPWVAGGSGAVSRRTSSFGLARCWRGLSLARGVVAVALGASFGECVGDLVASGAYVRAFVHDGHVPSRARLPEAAVGET